MKTMTLKEILCHHVTGAIERGEAKAIAGIPAQLHTPGPWDVTEKAIIGNNGGTWIAEHPAVKWQTLKSVTKSGDAIVAESIKQANANANLIASAPDLLEALRFLLADYIAIQGDKLTGSSVPIEMAQAAIAKAEGNQ